MDGVNPDQYRRCVDKSPVETIPDYGNYLFNRFPIMVKSYHGTLTYWMGLPMFDCSVTGVAGIRVARALLVVCVLSAVWGFLRTTHTSLLITAIMALALALIRHFSICSATNFTSLYSRCASY
jgi:hypothetical protein